MNVLQDCMKKKRMHRSFLSQVPNQGASVEQVWLAFSRKQKKEQSKDGTSIEIS